MKIEIWGDFACPFCYMEETRLEQVAAKSGISEKIEIEFKAYELDPKSPVIPRHSMQYSFEKGHDLTPEEALKQMAQITRLASHLGLEYHLEGVKVCNTLDAHRLMKYCAAKYDHATVIKLNFALFKANFTENQMLSDHNVLKGIATSVGMDAEGVETLLSGTEYTAEVRADEAAADKMDLEYIPYMLFPGGKVLQGVMSNGAIKQALGI